MLLKGMQNELQDFQGSFLGPGIILTSGKKQDKQTYLLAIWTNSARRPSCMCLTLDSRGSVYDIMTTYGIYWNVVDAPLILDALHMQLIESTSWICKPSMNYCIDVASCIWCLWKNSWPFDSMPWLISDMQAVEGSSLFQKLENA